MARNGRLSTPRRFLPGDPRVEEPYLLTPQLALRVAILGFVALALFAVLFLRLWALQVLAGDKYVNQADRQQAQKLMDHPLPHWVERMMLTYLAAYGGKAERRGNVWNLTFPDGEHFDAVVFTASDADAAPSARHLTLENRVGPGPPVPWPPATCSSVLV